MLNMSWREIRRLTFCAFLALTMAHDLPRLRATFGQPPGVRVRTVSAEDDSPKKVVARRQARR